MSAAAASAGSGQSVRAMAEAAKGASRILAGLDEVKRNAALEAMALAIEGARAELLAANLEDVRAEGGSLSSATLARLKLDEAKLAEMAEQVRSVARLPDPLGRVLDAIELDEGLDLTKISVPLGVLAVIFEARPDAVTQIAALAIKSGNAVMLKAGKEVEGTAGVLVQVLREALVEQGLPADAVSLVVGRRAGAGAARDAWVGGPGDPAGVEGTGGVCAGEYADSGAGTCGGRVPHLRGRERG